MRNKINQLPGIGITGTGRRRRGFTLIEVLVATLIMGITIAAVSEVIRTGIRAWRAGHGASELEQSVRITQDVVMRDLDNTFYKNETDYNTGFRTQLGLIASQMGAQIAQNPANYGKIDQMINQALHGKKRFGNDLIKNPGQNELTLQDISPPLNLTFHGTESELSFARTYRPRFAGDQDTWGIRRVTLFVRDKVLYRKEEDPFGLRINSIASSQRQQGDANNPMIIIQEQLAHLFAVPDQADQKEGSPQEPEAAALLPTQVRIEEPLCGGIEVFKIKYGYFMDGKWQEDTKWDSQNHEHRTPPELLANEQQQQQQGNPLTPVNSGPGTPYLAGMVQSGGQRQPGMGPLGGMFVPDDLPGSITIQLGVRMPDGKGRIFNFTIFHSLPSAKETDILMEDPNGRPLR